MILANTSVEVMRVPRSQTDLEIKWAKKGQNQRFKDIKHLSSSTTSFSSNSSEVSKIQSISQAGSNMMKMSYDSKSSQTPSSYGSGVPPPWYVCHRCGESGHYIHQCPTNEDPDFDFRKIKTATGIPRSQLKRVDPDEGEDGAVMLPEGGVAIMQLSRLRKNRWEKRLGYVAMSWIQKQERLSLLSSIAPSIFVRGVQTTLNTHPNCFMPIQFREGFGPLSRVDIPRITKFGLTKGDVTHQTPQKSDSKSTTTTRTSHSNHMNNKHGQYSQSQSHSKDNRHSSNHYKKSYDRPHHQSTIRSNYQQRSQSSSSHPPSDPRFSNAPPTNAASSSYSTPSDPRFATMPSSTASQLPGQSQSYAAPPAGTNPGYYASQPTPTANSGYQQYPYSSYQNQQAAPSYSNQGYPSYQNYNQQSQYHQYHQRASQPNYQSYSNQSQHQYQQYSYNHPGQNSSYGQHQSYRNPSTSNSSAYPPYQNQNQNRRSYHNNYRR